MSALLIFLGGSPGWLRLAEGRVVARGSDLEAVPAADEESEIEEAVLVVPGSEVALHWAELPPGLAPAQARAAARIMAAEVSAEPLATLHVAVGTAAEGEAERCLALVARDRMEHWLSEAQAIGWDPDRVAPEPLLLPPPENGVHLFKRGGLDNVRGYRRAFAAEPDIAALLLGEEAVTTLDRDAFEAGLAEALDILPVDLRQGDFAKRRRWTIDWPLIRRLAMLAGAILLVTLFVQLVMIARYEFATDAVERETVELARNVVPGNAEIVDPAGQLREQIRNLGGGPGYAAIAGAVFAAVRETPEAEMRSMIWTDQNALRVSIAVPNPAELGAFEQRLADAGLIVEPGAQTSAAGRQIGEYVVRAP